MANSNLVEVTMETVDTVIFRAISEIQGKSKRPDECRIYNFVNNFLDDSDVADGSFWERMKGLENQRVTINRQFFHFYQMCMSLHEPTDNNSNTINTTPAVSLPSNTPVYSNYCTYISLLSEGMDSLEQFFDMQLQNLTQILPVKSISKETNAKNDSDVLIESLQDTIHILKKTD